MEGLRLEAGYWLPANGWQAISSFLSSSSSVFLERFRIRQDYSRLRIRCHSSSFRRVRNPFFCLSIFCFLFFSRVYSFIISCSVVFIIPENAKITKSDRNNLVIPSMFSRALSCFVCFFRLIASNFDHVCVKVNGYWIVADTISYDSDFLIILFSLLAEYYAHVTSLSYFLLFWWLSLPL